MLLLKKIASLVVILQGLFLLQVEGQLLKGQISDEDGKPVSGAFVYWPGKENRVFTNSKGEFEIQRPDSIEIYLVAGARGFQTDTFIVDKKTFAYIEISRLAQDLRAVEIIKSKSGSFIDQDKTAKTEVITQKELTKAACCDMAGCFETQGTVQPQTTNVITNAKELRILGLSGVYNQVLIDGLPMIQGLSYTYGISTIPAAIIDQIFVAKGANSVLQGFEGISGQINVVSRNPEKEPNLYANGYVNNFGERHHNLNYAAPVGQARKWHFLAGIHAVQPANKRDRDADGFIDVTRLERQSVFNKWIYGKENEKGFYAQISGRWTHENRVGGQRNFNPDTEKGSLKNYGQMVAFQQPEFVSKVGYRFSAQHALSSQISAMHHEQESYYGTLKYSGNQQNLNALIQHQWNWHDAHSITWGGSFRYQMLREDIAFTDTIPRRSYQGTYRTDLQVPGIFAEHTARFFEEKLIWIAGIRLDRHQDFGSYLTPRSLIKWDFLPQHTLRASVGTGWRQVNLFSENITLLASSRDVVWEEKLRPEKALNWGLNYTHSFSARHVSGSFSADFYQTRFQNQFFPDFDREAGKAFIRNFTGSSVSNGFQADVNLMLFETYEWKLAYNFVEVFRMENGRKNLLPFNPANRIMTALSIRPPKQPYYLDFILHWFDRQRLPLTLQDENGQKGPEISKAYSLVNAQITWKVKKLEVYGGVENIFDFRQKQPIVGWQNPFGSRFDTSTVWGPTRGREFYIGFRWRWERVKPE